MSLRRAIPKAIWDEGGFDLERMEAITPHVVPPWWIGPSMYVEESAEKAQARHRQSIRSEPNATHIYTDGTGMNGPYRRRRRVRHHTPDQERLFGRRFRNHGVRR
jgi:hypothetical protein